MDEFVSENVKFNYFNYRNKNLKELKLGEMIFCSIHENLELLKEELQIKEFENLKNETRQKNKNLDLDSNLILETEKRVET